MRMKCRDVRSGSTYGYNIPSRRKKFEKAHIMIRKLSIFVYNGRYSASSWTWKNYEQYEIPVEVVEEEMKYILENMGSEDPILRQ